MRKDTRQYVIEIDDLLYHCSKGEVLQIRDVQDLTGNIWYITDLVEGNAHVMHLDTPARYADVMARKAVQESGEFDEPIHVINHWKRSTGPNASSAFFTACPVRQHSVYTDMVHEHNDCFFVFPLFAVLHKILLQTNPKTPTVIIFRHDRYADLLIASTKYVYFAGRCTAFDQSDDQIESLWGSIMSDITSVELEKRIKVEKIIYLNWLDSEPAPKLPPGREDELVEMPSENFLFDENKIPCSFISALRHLSANQSISPFSEKTFYFSSRMLLAGNFICLLLIGALFFGMYWYKTQSDQLASEISATRATIAGYKREKEVQPIDYKEHLHFITELQFYRNQDSFSDVIADVTNALPPGIIIDVVKIDNEAGALKIETVGRLEANFEESHQHYQSFVMTMQGKGYELVISDFNSAIQKADFLVTFEKTQI